jgi:hypothetical protein
MKILWTVCLAVLLGGAGLAAQASRSASDELNKSREELKQLLTKYTNQHPRVLMKREQIVNLEKAAALQGNSEPLLQLPKARELQKALENLKELLTKFTDQHPAVVAKRQQIVALEKSLNSD